jgi:ribonuclease HII
VAAAIILPAEIDWERDCWLLDVTDSKCLSEPAREELSPLILGWARAVGVGSAGVDEIDRLNIYHASHLAMVRAVEELGQTIWPEHLLVDGNVVPKKLREGFSFSTAAVVKGDLKCLSIAAASIVAKVYRDGLMKKWDEEFPVYGFSSHKGYGTPAHLAALGTHGVCPLHRRSFAPVAAVVSSLV